MLITASSVLSSRSTFDIILTMREIVCVKMCNEIFVAIISLNFLPFWLQFRYFLAVGAVRAPRRDDRRAGEGFVVIVHVVIKK